MLNRVARETDPRGKERTFGCDANSNRTEVVDCNGRQRTFKYDTLDRMTGETWWNGSTAGTQFTYTYNAVGNRLTANDGTSFYAYVSPS
ncbi:MAG: RHS repeat domain-containing protein [Gemmatales bacterium]